VLAHLGHQTFRHESDLSCCLARSRLAFAGNRLAFAGNRLASAWSRLAFAWNRLASAWSRLAFGWNRLAFAWNRLASAWNEGVRKSGCGNRNQGAGTAPVPSRGVVPTPLCSHASVFPRPCQSIPNHAGETRFRTPSPLKGFENRRISHPPPLGSPCGQGEPSFSGSPHAVGGPAGGGQKLHFRTPSRGLDNPCKVCYNRGSRALEKAWGENASEGGHSVGASLVWG
jgi:hypothetical protein